MTIPVSDGFPLFRLPFANDRKRQAAFFLNIFAWVLTTVAVIVGAWPPFWCMNRGNSVCMCFDRVEKGRMERISVKHW